MMLFPLLMLAPAGAQNFPNKAVRLIVPSSPGSGFDVIGRITAAGLAEEFGQQVVVDNRCRSDRLPNSSDSQKRARAS